MNPLRSMAALSERRLGVVRLLSVLLVAASTLGVASTAEAATGLVVSAGYDGYAQPGRAYPVTVEVSTDELFEGQLRITSGGGAYGTTRAVEFAGGTVNEITVVVEQSPFDSGDITVALVATDGEVVERTTVRMRNPSNLDLVGVFPGATGADMPEKVSTAADSGDAQLFAIDPGALNLGVGALGPIDIVVVDASDLRGLSDEGSAVLLAWVNLGGRLLVDEPIGSDISGVPVEWQPEGSMPQQAGLGEIILTDGAAAAGDWASILEPAPTRSRQEDESFGELAGFFGGEPLSWSLGRDAGFSLPAVSTMGAMLVVYVVLVGPGLWLVLRMFRRPGLAWVVVPVVALVVTGVIWLAGSSYRDGVETVHGSIIEIGTRGTLGSTYELLNSRGGGTKSIDLPEGWSSVASSQEGPAGFVDVLELADGERVSTEVDAGGFVVLGATGVLPEYDGAIEVVATSGVSGEVVGIFTNRLDVDLHDVAVFADAAGVNIGDVAAGKTAEYSVRGAPANPFNGEPAEFRIWGNALPPEWTGNFGRPFTPGPINLSLWSEVSARSGINARQVGTVVVAGWTDELASPIHPDVPGGRTLVMTRAGIQAEGSDLSDVVVPRSVVRGPSELGSDFRSNGGWGGGVMVRFLVPVASTDDLVLEVPTSQQRVEVFVDEMWQRIDNVEDDERVFSIPKGAIDDGRVYVRALLDFERGIVWRDLSVRSPGSGEKVRPMVLVPTEGAG